LKLGIDENGNGRPVKIIERAGARLRTRRRLKAMKQCHVQAGRHQRTGWRAGCRPDLNLAANRFEADPLAGGIRRDIKPIIGVAGPILPAGLGCGIAGSWT
jgi:hypothetical protein